MSYGDMKTAPPLTRDALRQAFDEAYAGKPPEPHHVVGPVSYRLARWLIEHGSRTPLFVSLTTYNKLREDGLA